MIVFVLYHEIDPSTPLALMYPQDDQVKKILCPVETHCIDMHTRVEYLTSNFYPTFFTQRLELEQLPNMFHEIENIQAVLWSSLVIFIKY